MRHGYRGGDDHSQPELRDRRHAYPLSGRDQAFLTREALANIADTTLANLDAYFAGAPLENEICYRCTGPLTPSPAACPRRTSGRCRSAE